MSSIDAAADKFFAEMLLSLRQAMQRRGASFYPAGPDAAASSYWEPVAARGTGVAELAPGAEDGSAMVRALGAYWEAEGERMLPRLIPGLEALRGTAMAPDAGDKDEATKITEFVYPLH
jgi:hypothetical protein